MRTGMSHQFDLGIEFSAAETKTACSEGGDNNRRVKRLYPLYVKDISNWRYPPERTENIGRKSNTAPCYPRSGDYPADPTHRCTLPTGSKTRRCRESRNTYRQKRGVCFSQYSLTGIGNGSKA